MTSRTFPTTATLLLLALLLAGLGRILILPPFEGVDETAHYSRIRATAARSGAAEEDRRIDRAVYDYYSRGPMAPGWILNDWQHHDDPRVKKPGDAMWVYKDYREFFGEAAAAHADYRALYREKPFPPLFSPSPQVNWQYQHSGIYYSLLAPLFRLADGLPLIPQLLVLRAANFLLAFAGIGIAALAIARHFGRGAAALGLFYPFLMPTFFMDVARLGNDNLCLLLFSCAFLLLLEHLRRPRETMLWILLGIALGLCCLAKATMVPAAAGALAFLWAHHAWRKEKFPARLAAPVTIAGLAFFVGVQGYVSLLASGRYPGDNVIGHWAGSASCLSGGSWMCLPWKTLFLNAFFTLESIILHFSDWSHYPFPAPARAFGLLPVLLALAFYAPALRRPLSAESLPAWIIPPLCGALLVHGFFYTLSNPAVSFTPAWYVHALAPGLMLACGLGLSRGLAGKGRAATITALAAALLSTAAYMQEAAFFYSGCDGLLIRTAGVPACPGAVLERLEILAWPRAGIACLVPAFILAAGGLLRAASPGNRHAAV